MPKPQDIFQLAQQEAVRVTASPQAWQSFLYTAAHNYHTTYLNQLLIHAQRPDAAACASMEYWNTKANRLVMRGSRSITVLQRRQGVAVTKPVFAIGDTTLLSQTHTGGPWEVTDTTRLLLLQGKPDDWLTALAQDGVSNEADRAHRMLERNVADSTLQWAQPDEQMQLLQALVTQSAVYMARLRIGLPEQDEDYPAFQSVSQFDTYQISLCLGGYLQAAAEPMLDAIGREALRLNRDSIAISHEPVHNESTPTQLNSREEAVTHDVHEEPRRLPDSEPFPAEPAEPVPEPLREAASGLSGAERADALRPADAGGHAADELQPNRTDSTADGGQDPARADADHPDAGPHDEPAGLGTADQQPEEAGGGSSPSDAVRNLTESPAQAESEQSPSAFALPEFSPTLLPQLLAMETSSRAYNAEYLTFYNKNPLLIDRLRFVRESYKDIFTELLLADDTRVGFHRQDNGLLVWQGAYLTRSAETLLSWRAVANALNDLIEQHELIAAIDPKKLPQVDIHVVMAADLRQLVCKGNIDCTESILNDLGHLSSTDVGNNDLALAERRIELLHLFTDSLVICADGAVVVQQFVDHVARDDALRSMDKVDILTNLKAICLNHRADILVDSSRRNSRLHDNRCALRADTHDILHGLDNVAGINLLAELVIRSRNRHDVGICNLILGGELYTSCQSVLEQLIQSLFLKSGLARIQSCNQFLIVVSTDNFHTVRSHHQSSRQTNVAQANYVNHFSFLRLLLQQFM